MAVSDEIPSLADSSRPILTVRAMLEDPGLGIELAGVAGAAGLGRRIEHPRIQKSGLALAGHYHGIVPSRVQILGQTELSYLQRLDAQARRASIRGFFELGLCCVVTTQGVRTERDYDSTGDALPVPELRDCAEETGTPLVISTERSSVTITALHALLDDRLAPRVRLHAVLVDVFGVGLLLMGSSGIGKSECALDLVMRGHRLVADDVVECDYRPPGMVFGAPADLLRHHLEVRGLGILNVKDLYGVTAIRERKRVDVVVRLVEWSKDTEYDRLGLEDHVHEILGCPIRELIIPVRPGRDMASILEVAARNELLRSAGHSAQDFLGQIEGTLLSEQTQITSVPATLRQQRALAGSSVPPAPVTTPQASPPAREPAQPRVPGPGPGAYRHALRAPESSASIPRPPLPPTKPRSG